MFKRLALSLAVLAASTSLLAQTPVPAPAAPQVRLRATIEKIDATSITIKERSGEIITLIRPAAMDVTEVYPIALADIKPGKQDEAALLVPGAKVLITAQEQGGKPTALRVVVGRNGFAPPM